MACGYGIPAAESRAEMTGELPMEQRPLGKTGLSVSVLGYGCGAIGGLMVKGSAA